MKRLLVCMLALTVLLVLSSVSAPFAQHRIETGVKAGLNLSKCFGDLLPQDWKTGFCGGTFVAIYLNDVLAIQPEVLFSMKGTKWTLGDATTTAKLNYCEIPVLVKVAAPSGSPNRFLVFAGPYLGVKLSAKGTVATPEGEQTREDQTIRKTDFGMVLGTGVDVRHGFSTFLIDIRYVVSIADIDDLPGEAKNKVVSLMIGYAF